ncbi:uncharacterized protein N7515_004046 [Penicillium bovifimosum]|uniref:Uncharacterized protein n=1 Tax=Penicillium bovifimosum TaxID=126998 RepID=A0A9W9L592_9EURO|nr:uncharacterized protein N7515_004046 [Penicillium bovifimosum]KAJ5139198.1 hypothetical protein N7515_004046 [Penicillium bovifimosum]
MPLDLDWERTQRAITLAHELREYCADSTRPHQQLLTPGVRQYQQYLIENHPPPVLVTYPGTAYRFPPDWGLDRPAPLRTAVRDFIRLCRRIHLPNPLDPGVADLPTADPLTTVDPPVVPDPPSADTPAAAASSSPISTSEAASTTRPNRTPRRTASLLNLPGAYISPIVEPSAPQPRRQRSHSSATGPPLRRTTDAEILQPRASARSQDSARRRDSNATNATGPCTEPICYRLEVWGSKR